MGWAYDGNSEPRDISVSIAEDLEALNHQRLPWRHKIQRLLRALALRRPE